MCFGEKGKTYKEMSGLRVVTKDLDFTVSRVSAILLHRLGWATAAELHIDY